MKIPSPVNVSCQYPAEVRGKPLFAWGKPHGGFVLVREDGQQAFPLPIKPAFLKRPQKKSDYHRTSAGVECGALYFFKLDSGGVSIMSGGYGLIVPTG
jgi:hypothetical protein